MQGLEPKRELTIIRRIATGSLRNKILYILPAALLLSQFLPWLLTPIFMLGGLYLCYEGAEKLWEKVSGHAPAARVGWPEGVSPSGSHRTRRDSLPSPGSCHPAHQADVTQRQCRNMRGYPEVISANFRRAARVAS